jgi:hypothetical protein
MQKIGTIAGKLVQALQRVLVTEVAKFLGGGPLEMPCRGGRLFPNIAPRILISSYGSRAQPYRIRLEIA